MSAKLHLRKGAHQINAACLGSKMTPATAPVLDEPALRLARSPTGPGGGIQSMRASDRSWPTGVAYVASSEVPGGRIYVCDADAHTIDVLDETGRPLFSFGGFGGGIGQLDTPTDIAAIRLETADAGGLSETPLLVVADRGNHRLQLFELDGAGIAELGGQAGAWTASRFPAPTGSPFFRVGDVPPLPFPSHLSWRAPYLDVVCAGTTVRLELAAVLLPDFTTWLADASRHELRRAFLRFGAAANHAVVPESCLCEIAERLQSSRRATTPTRLPRH